MQTLALRNLVLTLVVLDHIVGVLSICIHNDQKSQDRLVTVKAPTLLGYFNLSIIAILANPCLGRNLLRPQFSSWIADVIRQGIRM